MAIPHDPVHFPRLALRPEQAAQALGVSRSFFFAAILPELRVVSCGRLRLVPVTELETWLDQQRGASASVVGPGSRWRTAFVDGTRPGAPRERAGAVNCDAGWEAFVFSARDGRKVRQHIPDDGAAKAWSADALSGLRRGTYELQAHHCSSGGRRIDGRHERRSRPHSLGRLYKPSAMRSYEAALRLYIVPALGALKLGGRSASRRSTTRR